MCVISDSTASETRINQTVVVIVVRLVVLRRRTARAPWSGAYDQWSSDIAFVLEL